MERGESPVGGEEQLEPSDAYLEEVFLRLRTLEGIPSELGRRGDAVDRYRRAACWRTRVDTLVPTERGMLLLNELVLALTEE